MEYLLKVSAIIILFYASYKILLNRETFFESNRTFLLLGLLTAFILPLITIPKYIVVEPTVFQNSIAINNVLPQSQIIEAENSLQLSTILTYIYLAGSLFLFIRFIIQFGSLITLLIKSTKQRVASYIYVITENKISPFSFFNWIVFNPKQFTKTELEQIITHEKIHAKQLHSIDIILAELICIALWFNPLVWLYKKDLRQNLEFIADKNVQENVNCKKSYQQLLLKTSVPNYQVALTNNFYNSLIKKRIVMLQKSKSKNRNQLKFLLIIPALAIFLMSFNTKNIYLQKETKTKESPAISKEFKAIATTNSNSKAFVAHSKSATKKASTINAKANTKIAQDMVAYFIENTFTDAELDNVIEKLKKHGVTLKIKNVKRNGDNKISSIKIEAKSKNSNANFSISNDDAIKTIKIFYNIKDDSISIGNTNNLLHDKDHVSWTNKVGAVKIKKSGKGSNAFVYSIDDEHDGEHEIIEDDDKIIIKKGNKIHELKKAHDKDENVFVISGGEGKTFDIIRADTINADGNIFKLKGNVVVKGKGEGKSIFVTSGEDHKVIEFKGEKGENEDVLFIKKDKDGNIVKEKIKTDGKNLSFKSEDGEVFKIRSSGSGTSNIWVDKDEKEDKIVTKIGKNGSTMFISGDTDKNPLIVIDGKVVKNKKLEDIDADNIRSINVLKGDSAEKKYGKKGKDGVIEITTKKKKNKKKD